jgi:3-deoxy-7-phosphoheptulonate synthase
MMVDCSHGNSGKDPGQQPIVAEDLVSQILDGNRSIMGLMLESNLSGGRQSIDEGVSGLRYGVSVTDGCIDWETTERLLRRVRDRLGPAASRG